MVVVVVAVVVVVVVVGVVVGSSSVSSSSSSSSGSSSSSRGVTLIQTKQKVVGREKGTRSTAKDKTGTTPSNQTRRQAGGLNPLMEWSTLVLDSPICLPSPTKQLHLKSFIFIIR